MKNGNGGIPIIGRPVGKDSDLITVAQARALIADEATKVHEFYMRQIPEFVARMIQDALLGFGLIKMDPAVEQGLVASALATAEAPAMPEDAGGDEPPADSTPTPEVASEEPSGLYEITKTPFEDTLTGDPAAPQKVSDAFPPEAAE